MKKRSLLLCCLIGLFATGCNTETKEQPQSHEASAKNEVQKQLEQVQKELSEVKQQSENIRNKDELKFIFNKAVFDNSCQARDLIASQVLFEHLAMVPWTETELVPAQDKRFPNFEQALNKNPDGYAMYFKANQPFDFSSFNESNVHKPLKIQELFFQVRPDEKTPNLYVRGDDKEFHHFVLDQSLIDIPYEWSKWVQVPLEYETQHGLLFNLGV